MTRTVTDTLVERFAAYHDCPEHEARKELETLPDEDYQLHLEELGDGSEGISTDKELEQKLFDILAERCDGPDADFDRVTTYEDASMLTNNAGLVLRLANGAEFQLTIVQSRRVQR